jgi:DNA-binding transcriptional LysR family regulator
MSITLCQLRYFVAAVEAGKLSSAAAECNVSQSAVTLSLRTLEDQVGVKLLDRHHSGVTLTYEGHRFLPKARDILSAVAEATHSGAAMVQSTSGQVRIGVTYTVFGYFVGPHLARFKRRFPEIELQIVQLDRQELEKSLTDGNIDIAVLLVSNLTDSRRIASQVLLPSQRRLWLPPGHRLVQDKSPGLKDVASEPYIMLTVDEAEQTTLRYWRKYRQKPKVVMRTSSVEAVRTMVAAGMGVTILSDMVYRPWSLEGDRIEIRNLADHIPSMDVGLAWSMTKALSTPVQEFRNFLQLSYARHFT